MIDDVRCSKEEFGTVMMMSGSNTELTDVNCRDPVQEGEIVTAMACLDSDGLPSTANPGELIPHVKRFLAASRRTACTAALVLRKVNDVRACGEERTTRDDDDVRGVDGPGRTYVLPAGLSPDQLWSLKTPPWILPQAPSKPANVPLFVQLDSASDNKCSFNRYLAASATPQSATNLPPTTSPRFIPATATTSTHTYILKLISIVPR